MKFQDKKNVWNLCEYCDLSNEKDKCSFNFELDNSGLCNYFCIDEDENMDIEEVDDYIHRPHHYGKFTPIDAFVSGLVSEKDLKGFFKCNIIKYCCRYEFKNGVEDLKKAEEYIKLLIKLENNELKVGD